MSGQKGHRRKRSASDPLASLVIPKSNDSYVSINPIVLPPSQRASTPQPQLPWNAAPTQGKPMELDMTTAELLSGLQETENFKFKSNGARSLVSPEADIPAKIGDNVYQYFYMPICAVAVKLPNQNRPRELPKEIKALRRVNNVHPHIVKAVAYCSHPPVLVLELLPNGSLQQLLEKDIVQTQYGYINESNENTVSLDFRLQTMIDATSALDFMLRNGMVHSDVKPANFLLDHYKKVRLTDLGLWGPLGESREFWTGTLRYSIPTEYESGEGIPPYTATIVTYALGLTMLNIISPRTLIRRETTKSWLENRSRMLWAEINEALYALSTSEASIPDRTCMCLTRVITGLLCVFPGQVTPSRDDFASPAITLAQVQNELESLLKKVVTTPVPRKR